MGRKRGRRSVGRWAELWKIRLGLLFKEDLGEDNVSWRWNVVNGSFEVSLFIFGSSGRRVMREGLGLYDRCVCVYDY